MAKPKLMTVDEAIAAIVGNHPIVIETRKYGIVADWYSARNKNEFYERLRRRVVAGEYPRLEYNQTWRGWQWEPEENQRMSTKWA